MAVPKKRMSHARKMSRRAQHDKITPPTLTSCRNCSNPVRPHRICGQCGQYRGRQVIASILPPDDLGPPAAAEGQE